MNPKIDFNKPVVALDYETFPIGEGEPPTHPKPVVLSIYDEAGNNELIHRKNPIYPEACKYLLQPGHILAGQNIAYDIGVMYYDNPSLITAIMDKYENGEIYDTALAEKLMNLSSIGVIKEGFVKGKKINFRYSLADLTYNWLGVDMSEDKGKPTEEEVLRSEEFGKQSSWTEAEIKEWDSCGAWRMRYAHLWNFTDISSWPYNAKRYALADSEYTAKIANMQIAVGKDKWEKPFDTLGLQCMKAFAFALRTSLGIYTDQEEVKKVKAWVDENLEEEKLEPILKEGIYIPACPGREYKTRPGVFTKPKKSSMKKRPLQEYIIKLLREGKITKKEIGITDTGQKDVEFMAAYKECTDSGALADLLEQGRVKDKQFKGIVKQVRQEYIGYIGMDKHFQKAVVDLEIGDPVIDTFIHYKKFSGLRNNEVPRMENPILYPNYDPLKETGRSSSFGGDLYPSCNIQQINAIIRKAYRAREGYYMLSTDYGSMELVTAAQTCLDMLGYSTLADKLNKGYDVHAYLGAQIALRKDEVFGKLLEEDQTLIDDPDKVYQLFMDTKKTDEDFFKKYRSLAKPVGLGFWGGLGAKTFIQTAKTIYGVIIESEAEAKELKAIWQEVFPEAKAYFPTVTQNYRDPTMSFNYIDEEGKEKTWQKYMYKSPYGMLRRNCDYTQIMNGLALQTPGGEGAMTSMWMITRESFDPSKNSVLLDNYIPYGFIHDEELGDVKQGKEYEVSVRVSELMLEGFKYVCGDVKIKAEPALMTHWNKKAESVTDHENKTITLWQEEEK